MNRIPLLILLSLCILTGCRHNSAADLPQGDTLTTQSNLLTIVDAGDYYVADIANPWAADTSLLERYILAPRDFDGTLPQGNVIRIPLANSIVYSGVHGGAIDELGAIDAIAAVADGMYFTNPSLSTRIADGTIKDIGNSMSPSQEMIIDINPDAILLSPYQDQDLGAVGKLGIPLIQCVDYMESTPLGRAEWIKLLGILYGATSQADSIYQKVTADYTALRDKAAQTQNRPKVITEQPLSGGIWSVPGGKSYMACMLRDAGATYPWADTDASGSLQLDAARVYDTASDADFWLIRNYEPLTLQSLGMNNPLSGHFKAFKQGGVYICNTAESPIFDEFPFHPERLFADYIAIFHPDIIPELKPRYYQKAQ